MNGSVYNVGWPALFTLGFGLQTGLADGPAHICHIATRNTPAAQFTNPYHTVLRRPTKVEHFHHVMSRPSLLFPLYLHETPQNTRINGHRFIGSVEVQVIASSRSFWPNHSPFIARYVCIGMINRSLQQQPPASYHDLLHLLLLLEPYRHPALVGCAESTLPSRRAGCHSGSISGAPNMLRVILAGTGTENRRCAGTENGCRIRSR